MPDVAVVPAAVLVVVAAAVLVVVAAAVLVVVATAVLAAFVVVVLAAFVVAGLARAFVGADVLDTRDAAAFFVAAGFSTALAFFPAAALAAGLPGAAAFVATDRRAVAEAEARLMLGRADGIPARPFSRTGPRNWPV